MTTHTFSARIAFTLAFSLIAIPVLAHAANTYHFSTYGYKGTIDHAFTLDTTDPKDLMHATDSVAVTFNEDGSGTAIGTWHSTETRIQTYDCTHGSYSYTEVKTIDGTSTGSFPGGTVRIGPTFVSKYALTDILPSNITTIPVTVTTTTTYSGGSSQCPSPDNSTETTTDTQYLPTNSLFDLTLADPEKPEFSGSVTEDSVYNPSFTDVYTASETTTWNFSGCGEELGSQWADRFPLPYTNEKEALAQLSPSFGPKVKKFITALRNASATVTVNTTYRPQPRAYLMANAWLIYDDKIKPSAVAKYPGVDRDGKAVKSDGSIVPICWQARNSTTGAVDDDQTDTLADAMVTAYDIDGAAGYPTEHMKRNAVDISISWKNALVIRQGPILPKGTPRAAVRITSGKKDGSNAALWRVGASYGIIKGPLGKNKKNQDLRVVDKVHWSTSGK